MMRGSVAGMAAMLALLTACNESPTTASQELTAEDELTVLLAEVGAVDDPAEPSRAGPRDLPTLRFLLHRALRQVAAEEGVEAARSIAAELRRKQQEIRRQALEEGTREARRRAAAAIELEAAKVVIRILGPEVVERVMGIAEERIARLEARIDAAPDGANTARLERLLARLKEELALARAALPTDAAQSLIHALRAVQGLERHLPMGRQRDAREA